MHPPPNLMKTLCIFENGMTPPKTATKMNNNYISTPPPSLCFLRHLPLIFLLIKPNIINPKILEMYQAAYLMHFFCSYHVNNNGGVISDFKG